MATDYKKIAEDHKRDYGRKTNHLRFYKRLYNDKTHFVYELIQNADDSKSQHLELQLDTKTLLVWNDGRQFEEADVRNICSIGSSDKDLTQIGNFGIGFKAVYNYTDLPEIYSNDERFRIRDFIKPEGIDEMTPEIAKLVNDGKTVFRLPFKDILRQEQEITRLANRFQDLSKERSLLFLRHLEKIEWKDKRNAQTGSYSCHRCPYDKIQNAFEVELTVSLNGSNQSSETFLIFRNEVQPPQNVTNELLYQAEDVEEQQRIQRAATEPQSIEVAFKLQDSRITAMDDNCVLFAYLPTQKETHLNFLIQARYQTTPSRDNIPKPSENPWNRWLVQETAKFLPEILEQLKVSDLLEPAFFNVLPLSGDDKVRTDDKVPLEFKPIVKALEDAMGEKPLVPTQDGGYAKAENVFYPESTPLRKLVKSSGMHSDSSLLHPYIRKDAKESERCFDVMAKAGVKEINASDLLCWLERRSLEWFKDRTDEWLSSLYIYFNREWSDSQLERVKKLPLVRLENGEHTRVSDQLVYFPPDTDEARDEIGPFLTELPILRSTLLKGEDHSNINAFLRRKLGVKMLRSRSLITESICPLYRQPNKPAKMKNRRHVRYIFKSWQKAVESERSRLEKSISEVPILRAYKGLQREISDFVVPRKAYLPQAYTGDNDLETYFSVYDGDLWFVDDKYLTNKSDTKTWLQFLKAIGTMDTPQTIDIEVSGSSEECKKRSITYEYSTKPFENGKVKDIWFRRPYEYFDGHIIDRSFDGLSKVLAQIGNHNEIDLPKALWGLLVKLVSSLPSEEWKHYSFFNDRFRGIYRWSYRGPKQKFFDAAFYRQLKKTAWFPDEQGNRHSPDKCFLPTSKNQEVLGDSVTYLHSNFDISTRHARWLAKQLDVHLQADPDGVLDYLQTLSQTEVSIEKIEPIYRFLESEGTDLWRFEEEPLIFTPEPEPRWWRTDEVFWEDESEIFKNDRGYLKAHYPATLKSFFDDLGVSPQASQRDYALGIQKIATTDQAEDETVRERVQRLYKCLQPSREKKWEIIYDSRCWLGKRGDEWEFFTRQELVLKDHPHIGEIFEGEVPFWTFDDDSSSLARILRVEGCSQAEVEFHPEGDQEEDTDWSEKVRKLRPYIYAFLNSPRLCEESDIFMFSGNEELQKEKFAKFSTNCSVRQVKELRVTYELKGISVIDPNPRPSFLDITGQQAILWLGLEAHEDEYAELIGDALQDHFGVNELGRFVEDLLTPIKKQDRVLSNWKRKGFETKFLNEYPKDNEEKRMESLDEPNSGEADPAADESNMKIPTDNETPKTGNEDSDSLTDEADESETHLFGSGDDNSRTYESEVETSVDSETTEINKSDEGSTSDESEKDANLVSDVMDTSSPDAQSSTKTSSETTQNVSGESESETPTVHEDPETGNENDDSTENESEIPTYKPRPSGSRTRQRSGKAINTPNGNQSTGHNSRHSSGKEDDTHMEATDTSPQAKKEIEHAGMKYACRYEKEEGRAPKDVSSENRGYDIYSTSPDGKNRYIEVKARANRDSVVLTSKEWSVAKQLKDNYFLYIVLNAKTRPEPYIIRNPADAVSPVPYVTMYQVPLSEITEHGIRV